MASFNQATLVGNLGRDPEMRYSPNGQQKAEFSIATSRSWKKDDQWQEQTTWHNIVVWGERAERAAEQLRKGTQVLVVGRIENRSWDDEKNPGQKKYRSEVVADVVYKLGKREEGEFGAQGPDFAAQVPQGEFVGGPPRAVPSPRRQEPEEFDDLPF